ncbi:MAG: dienelactone hydrolase family protein [Candidatus Bathyarchaeota archaeon]|nr:dienelactone hydrolase family protein [Candidatus Bathyarchaeota archaeon]
MTHTQMELKIPVGNAQVVEGNLYLPSEVHGLVVFVHGSGSSRFSPRNQFVAKNFNKAALGTLLFDLLTPEEEEEDELTAHYRFNIDLLSERLVGVTEWLRKDASTRNLKLGYFGASTGAAAALIAAARMPEAVAAVVSRGGRPDLADKYLPLVKAPTLLLVGGWDEQVIELNRQAQSQMRNQNKLVIIPEATHLFEEPGKLEEVAKHSTEWFLRFLV